MSILKLTRLGNPILREVMPDINPSDIASKNIQQLIFDIRETNRVKQYGVGLSAPQVGQRFRLSLIGIKPTLNHPKVEPFDSVVINPNYSGIGRRTGMWEGCHSIGSGDDILYGKALRYEQIQANWYDENGVGHNEILRGFVAHVFQHETDHLNGILFIDRVSDKKSYMMADEYRQRIIEGQNE